MVKIDQPFWKRPDRHDQYQLHRWVNSLPKREFVHDGYYWRIGYDYKVEGGYYIERVCSVVAFNKAISNILTGVSEFFSDIAKALGGKHD